MIDREELERLVKTTKEEAYNGYELDLKGLVYHDQRCLRKLIECESEPDSYIEARLIFAPMFSKTKYGECPSRGARIALYVYKWHREKDGREILRFETGITVREKVQRKQFVWLLAATEICDEKYILNRIAEAQKL